ncbi:MAG: AAA family ATPase [Flavobacteriaceae bacterium]|jgi:predicted ATPase|nr:AAA family ATPase [Flavobacteriaceae bacterium]
MNKPQFYIVTGGPGSGKTTLLNALASKGYQVVPEVGRAIIQREQNLEGDAVPWKNKQLFYEAMLAQSITDYTNCFSQELVLWDRGIIDSIGYAILENLVISPIQRQWAEDMKYASHVFICPPWEEIYTQDKERKQDLALAIKTYEVMKNTYQRMGYTLVEVPKGTVKERVDFVIEVLKQQEDERNNRNR